MSDDSEERDVDVLILGCTGYAGQRMVEHLAALRAPPASAAASAAAAKTNDDDGPQWDWAGLTVGLAARSLNRLQRVLHSAAANGCGVEDRHVFAVDVQDARSLDDVTRRCKCVVNCVGPFYDFGEPVMASCVAQGADYVDLSGETAWIDAMHRKYHGPAEQAGVLLLSACGYDSVPADALALALVAEGVPAEQLGEGFHSVLQILNYMGQRKRFWGPFGGMGAGTFKTIVTGWHDRGRGIDVRCNEPDTDTLAAARSAAPASGRSSGLEMLDPAQRGRVAAFPGLGLYGVENELFSDGHVVRASQRLGAHPKPASLEVGNYFAAPYRVVAYVVALALWALPRLVRVGFVYRMLLRLMGSGDGPSAAQRGNARASFHARLRVYACERRDSEPRLATEVHGSLELECDPNDATAAFALRCAAALASPAMRGDMPRGGHLTTGAALGPALLTAIARQVGTLRLKLQQ